MELLKERQSSAIDAQVLRHSLVAREASNLKLRQELKERQITYDQRAIDAQHKIRQESEQLRSWKATREREVLQEKLVGLNGRDRQLEAILSEDEQQQLKTSQSLGQGGSDVEWLDDEDWVRNAKRMRKSRSIAPVLKPNAEVPREEAEANAEKSSLEVCCRCTYTSYCKTELCECWATGRICGPSCGCEPAKCINKGGPFEDCCLCTGKSKCILKKCECRAHGRICGPSCLCVASKCRNQR